MKIFEKKVVVRKKVKYIVCNRCGKKININKYEDFLDVKKTWGYHSNFDGETHSFQLCTCCYNKLIGSFKVKIKSRKI